MSLNIRSLALAAVSAATIMAANSAHASSFYIRTGQSAEGLGMQFSGAAAGGIGLGSIGWNPATITMFPGRNSQLNGTYLLPRAEYDLERTNLLPILVPGPGAALYGTRAGSGEIGGEGAFVPASYSSFQLTDRLFVGISSGAPFGLASKPENFNFAGQVYGRSAKIRTYNVSPMAGFRVNEWLSIGGALQVQYLKVNLKQAAAPFPNAPSNILEGDDFAFGYRLGVTVNPWAGGTIGLGFRSAMHHDLEGSFNSAGIPAGRALPRGEYDISANVNLPEVFTFGFSQQINERLQLHVGAEYENWSRFRRIPVVLDLAGRPFTSLNFEYEDSFYLSAGLEYAFNPALTLRTGISYEWSAVSDRVRQVLVADNDRLGLSAGLSYQISPKLKLDLSYAHYFIKDARAAIVGPGNPLNPGGNPAYVGVDFVGTAEPSLDVVSAALTYRWDDPQVAVPAPIVRKY